MNHLSLAYSALALATIIADKTSLAALPGGFEDTMFCPPGYCSADVDMGPFSVGPRSMFVECYNPDTRDVVEEFWESSEPLLVVAPRASLSATLTKAPMDWEEPPKCALYCPPGTCRESREDCYDSELDVYVPGFWSEEDAPSDFVKDPDACIYIMCDSAACEKDGKCFDPIALRELPTMMGLKGMPKPPRCVEPTQSPTPEPTPATVVYDEPSQAPVVYDVMPAGTTGAMATVGGVLSLGALAFLCGGR